MRARDYIDVARFDGLTAEQVERNEAIAYAHAKAKDTPARRWADANFEHPSIGRALGIDRAQSGGPFALFPFRVMRIDEVAHVCAAWPCPRTIGAMDDHLGIEALIAWNPVDNAVQIVGDAQPQVVGPMVDHYGAARLFGQPRLYFQEWARNRARFWGFVLADAGKSWRAKIEEPDLAPGALVVGPVSQVRWNPTTMPDHIECVGVDASEINKAVFKAMRMPRFTNGMRAAA